MWELVTNATHVRHAILKTCTSIWYAKSMVRCFRSGVLLYVKEKGLFVCCHWWLAQLTPTLAHSLQGNTVATCCIRSEVRYAQPQPVVAHCVPGLILSFFSGKHAGWTYLVSVNGFFNLSSTRLWSSLRYDRVRFDDDTLCEVPFESSGNLPQGWRTLSLHTKNMSKLLLATYQWISTDY